MSISDYTAPRPWLPRPRDMRSARALSLEGWIVVGLAVAAAVIRFLVIDNQSLWADEALTAFEARLPFGSMIHVVVNVETTPPLYFVLVWGWSHVFGAGAVALRMVSTLAGIALVPVAYLCGRELASRRAGVLAAAFVTVNPFLIWYSQEARSYMLLALLSALSFLYFARARGAPTRRNLIWWVVWSSLALMTHFFAGFLVAAEALWLLWAWRRRSVVAAAAAVAAVELAMLPFAALDTSHGPGWIAYTPRTTRVSNAIAEWGVSILYRHTPIATGLIAGAILVAATLLLGRFGGEERIWNAVRTGLGVAAFVWVAPLALAHVGQDYFLSRNVMPAVVPLAVAVSAACVAPRTRVFGATLAAALLVLFSAGAIRVQSHPYLERPNWRAVARALGPATVTRAILAADGTTAQPLKIYLPRVDWTEPRGLRVWIREVDIVGATKRLPLVPPKWKVVSPGTKPVPVYATGSPVPRSISVRGARLERRFKLLNWILAEYVLRHPVDTTINQLQALAPRYFRRTPQALLVFFQLPARR